MKRLTYWDGQEKGSALPISINEDGDTADIEDVCARLAAYEDTGLEPEAVEQIKLYAMGKSIAEIKEFDGVPVGRLRDLAQAERDGRLVSLPCKVGTLVYRIGASVCKWRDIDRCDSYCNGYEYNDCWEGGRAVLEDKFNLSMLDLIGRTIFMTREEAEVALDEQKGCNENG